MLTTIKKNLGAFIDFVTIFNLTQWKVEMQHISRLVLRIKTTNQIHSQF